MTRPAPPSRPSHPRDISNADLEVALDRAMRPDLLRALVEIGRRALTFFPAQVTYALVYPWAAGHLERLAAGTRVLDIGAGLNPLPLFCAERDLLVDAVDGHAVVRVPPAQPSWNEWGFFDYGALDARVSAHHCPIADFSPPGRYGAIYSMCSLAHMTRAVREDALRRAVDWLLPGADLLLALDLIPGTDFIWNYSEGTEVEPRELHGTVTDVLRTLEALGCLIIEAKAVRQIPTWSRTDVLLIRCTRPT